MHFNVLPDSNICDKTTSQDMDGAGHSGNLKLHPVQWVAGTPLTTQLQLRCYPHYRMSTTKATSHSTYDAHEDVWDRPVQDPCESCQALTTWSLLHHLISPIPEHRVMTVCTHAQASLTASVSGETVTGFRWQRHSVLRGLRGYLCSGDERLLELCGCGPVIQLISL